MSWSSDHLVDFTDGSAPKCKSSRHPRQGITSQIPRLTLYCRIKIVLCVCERELVKSRWFLVTPAHPVLLAESYILKIDVFSNLTLPSFCHFHFQTVCFFHSGSFVFPTIIVSSQEYIPWTRYCSSLSWFLTKIMSNVLTHTLMCHLSRYTVAGHCVNAESASFLLFLFVYFFFCILCYFHHLFIKSLFMDIMVFDWKKSLEIFQKYRTLKSASAYLYYFLSSSVFCYIMLLLANLWFFSFHLVCNFRQMRMV